jgi:hypothetical protein
MIASSRVKGQRGDMGLVLALDGSGSPTPDPGSIGSLICGRLLTSICSVATPP